MPEYRVYPLLGARLGAPDVLTADDDAHAIVQAKALKADGNFELWQLGRLVGRYEFSGKKPKP
ncbi:hypothetical protein [Phenylobacterium sp.]|uniref:hypothetical protein n=1 Tax=Phenylobacterium sp. TaxID=1871053 RepID=UPI0035AD85E6